MSNEQRAIVLGEVTVSVNRLSRELTKTQAGLFINSHLSLRDRANIAQLACDLMTESSRLMAAVVSE